MSYRTATWLAWSLWALSLALTALGLLLLALILSHSNVHIFDHWFDSTLAALSFSTVGAVLAPRAPSHNPIGWIFCVAGLLFAVAHFSAEYATYTLLAAPGSPLPGGGAAAWLTSWLWIPQNGSIMLTVLLFPDGRLPSRGWRWFVWLSVLFGLVGVLLCAFAPGPIIALGPIQNPLALVEGPPNVYKIVERSVNALMLVAVVSLFVRLRRAGDLERQQIKWFVYATVLAIGGAVLAYPVSEAIGSASLEWIGFVLLVAGVMATPISIGMAIMRYRLYEIDLLINRTLVYGSLTVVLALVYFGGVATTQAIFRTITGREEQSQLAIVVSTLLIAALFAPLRRRIQGFIDRRFYRQKYDARKTLEAFSFTLREETDLNALCDNLIEVTGETMQPAHVSLWLRPAAPPRNTQAS
jgi:MFS family permease